MAVNTVRTTNEIFAHATTINSGYTLNSLVDVMDVDDIYDQRVDVFSVTSNYGSALVTNVWINSGGTSYQIGQKSITANAGNSTTAGIEILSSIPNIAKLTDNAGNLYINIPKGFKLQISATSAPTTTTLITYFVSGAKYN